MSKKKNDEVTPDVPDDAGVGPVYMTAEQMASVEGDRDAVQLPEVDERMRASFDHNADTSSEDAPASQDADDVPTPDPAPTTSDGPTGT